MAGAADSGASGAGGPAPSVLGSSHVASIIAEALKVPAAFSRLQTLTDLVGARLRLGDYLEPTTSYLSIVELGIYESTSKVYAALIEKGIQPYSAEWKEELESTLARHRQAIHLRVGR